jgi:hypothetical protein
MMGLGNRVDPGGGLIFGVQAAISLGPLAGQGSDHCRANSHHVFRFFAHRKGWTMMKGSRSLMTSCSSGTGIPP